VRFAVLELNTLIDGSGKFSLKLHKSSDGKKYQPQPSSALHLFPSLSSKERTDLLEKLTVLMSNNSSLIDRLRHTRNARIAHAKLLSRTYDHKSFRVQRFPKTRCRRFANGLNRIFWELGLGIDLA
jgi:hypothetical protein